MIGLVHTGEVEAQSVLEYLGIGKASSEDDPSAQIILKYKGVETGEVDWRPTETIPEDYYLL